MEFRDVLKSLRKKNKVTQEGLAASIGVERSSVGKYETGVIPSPDIVIRIADFFGVSLDELFDRKYPATHPPVLSAFQITPHEQALIEAYRNHPALCSAVDRMLEVAPSSSEDEANARTVSAVVEALRAEEQESVPTR